MLNIDYTLNRPIPLWELDKKERRVEKISSSQKINTSFNDELSTSTNLNNTYNDEESMMEMNMEEFFEKKYIVSVKEYEENKKNKTISHLELYQSYQAPLFYQKLFEKKEEESNEELINTVKTLRKIR